MSIFSWIFRRKPNHTLTEEERAAGRELSLLVRRQKQERLEAEHALHMAKIQREQARTELAIAKMEAEYTTDDAPQDEGMAALVQLGIAIAGRIMQPQNQSPIPETIGQDVTPAGSASTPSNANLAPQELHLSDDQLRTMKTKIPKTIIFFAKRMDDDTLRRKIIEEAPGMDADTVQRAMRIIRE